MKICTLALALMSLSSSASFAALPGAGERVMGLAETAAQLEARYPGKVAAIELDAAGDRAAHYHVDMQFPGLSPARLDVDAATLEIASRETASLAPGSVALVYAAALVTGTVPGELLLARLDATNGAPAHYDVDVALPHGGIARLKVDAATSQIGWRNPPIAND